LLAVEDPANHRAHRPPGAPEEGSGLDEQADAVEDDERTGNEEQGTEGLLGAHDEGTSARQTRTTDNLHLQKDFNQYRTAGARRELPPAALSRASSPAAAGPGRLVRGGVAGAGAGPPPPLPAPLPLGAL